MDREKVMSDLVRIVIESPLAGDIQANLVYARRCMLDSLRRGEAPFASHLLYTQVLDDLKPDERLLGMDAGFLWGNTCPRRVIYVDRGLSRGMKEGLRSHFQFHFNQTYPELLHFCGDLPFVARLAVLGIVVRALDRKVTDEDHLQVWDACLGR